MLSLANVIEVFGEHVLMRVVFFSVLFLIMIAVSWCDGAGLANRPTVLKGMVTISACKKSDESVKRRQKIWRITRAASWQLGERAAGLHKIHYNVGLQVGDVLRQSESRAYLLRPTCHTYVLLTYLGNLCEEMTLPRNEMQSASYQLTFWSFGHPGQVSSWFL